MTHVTHATHVTSSWKAYCLGFGSLANFSLKSMEKLSGDGAVLAAEIFELQKSVQQELNSDSMSCYRCMQRKPNGKEQVANRCNVTLNEHSKMWL